MPDQEPIPPPGDESKKDEQAPANKKEKKEKPVKTKDPEDRKLELIKIRYSFLKWLLGSFLIGAFTAGTTFILKSYELRLKTRQEESKYLQPYFNSYMNLFAKNALGYDRGADMAKFLSCAVADPDYKKGWNDLYTYCQDRINEINLQNKHLKQAVVTLVHTKAALKAQLNRTDITAPVKQKLIDSLNGVNGQISNTNVQINNNEKKISSTVPVTITPVHPVGDQQQQGAANDPMPGFTKVEDITKYMAETFAQTFYGNFDIHVNTIDVGNQAVTVDLYTVAEGSFTPFQNNVVMVKNIPQTISSPDGNFNYVVTVTSIVVPGPLSPRKIKAFFHVVTYKKRSI